MKNFYLVISFIFLFSIELFSQSDSTGWVYKNGYREQKLKVGAITFIRYSKDGKYLYTFGKDTTLRKWDLITGHLASEFIVKGAYTYNIDLNPDETEILNSSTILRLKDTAKININFNRNYKVPSKHCDAAIKDLKTCFHPVLNQIFIEADYDIECNTGTKDWVSSFSKEGRFEVYSYDGSFIYTDQEGSQKRNLTFSPDGLYEVHTTYWQEKGFDTHTGQWHNYEERYLVIEDRYYHSIRKFPAYSDDLLYAFTFDNKFLSICSNNGIAIIKLSNANPTRYWDFKTMNVDTPYAIGFTRDNKYFIIGAKNKGQSSIEFWDVSTGELFNSVSFDSSVTDWKLAFDRNSSDFATGTSDGIIRIFDSTLTISVKAGFSVDTNKIIVNDTVRFHNQSTGNPTTWDWDFGDGKFGSEKEPVHVYTKPGTYSVKLIVKNGWSSDTLVKNNLITVEPEPAGVNDNNTASRFFFSITPNPVTESSIIYFYIDKPQPIQIKLFNQLGQEVARIADSYFNSGSNNISFNPRDYALPSGLYYIQLSGETGMAAKVIYIEK